MLELPPSCSDQIQSAEKLDRCTSYGTSATRRLSEYVSILA